MFTPAALCFFWTDAGLVCTANMYATLQSLRRQQVNSVQNVPGSTGGWLGRLTGKPTVGREEDEEPWRQTPDAEGVAAVMTDGVHLILGRAVAHMVSRRFITAVARFQAHVSPFEVQKVALGWACAPYIILLLYIHLFAILSWTFGHLRTQTIVQ